MTDKGRKLQIASTHPQAQHDSHSLRFLITAISALLLLPLAAACSFMQPAPRIELGELVLDVTPLANNDGAFPVEIVAVADEELLKKLIGLSASQWFDAAAALRRDYPQTLASWYYELVPGQRLPLRPLPFAGRRAYGLLLYAGYDGRGAYRLRLDGLPRARVLFGERDLALSTPDRTGVR